MANVTPLDSIVGAEDDEPLPAFMNKDSDSFENEKRMRQYSDGYQVVDGKEYNTVNQGYQTSSSAYSQDKKTPPPLPADDFKPAYMDSKWAHFQGAEAPPQPTHQMTTEIRPGVQPPAKPHPQTPPAPPPAMKQPTRGRRKRRVKWEDIERLRTLQGDETHDGGWQNIIIILLLIVIVILYFWISRKKVRVGL